MNCPKCGMELPGDARFCHHCGYDWTGEAPSVQEEMPAGKKKNRKPLLIGICAGVVAVIILAVVLLGGFFSGPEGKILQAVNKSVRAYQQTEALSRFHQQKEGDEYLPAHHSVAVKLEQLPDVPMLEGMGLNVETDTDVEGRMLDMTVTPQLSSVDFMQLRLQLNGTTLYAAVPELLSHRVYSMDTKQVAKTLENLGMPLDGDLAGFGFDLFELLDILRTQGQIDTAALADAAAQLGKALEAEKLGKEDITVDGVAKNCEAYLLTIPQDALAGFLDAFQTTQKLSAQELADRLTQAMGLPSETVADSSLGELQDVLEKLGDIRLKIALCDGYVAAVSYEGTYEDEDEGIPLSLSALFGGSREYADHLSVRFTAGEDVDVTVTSSGDHCADTYTDTTTVESDGEVLLRSDLTWGMEGFSWVLTAQDVRMEAEGEIQLSQFSYDIRADRLELYEADELLMGLSLQLGMEEYVSPEPMTGDVFDLTGATREELEAEAQAVGEELFGWLMDTLSGDSPASDLLRSLLGL